MYGSTVGEDSRIAWWDAVDYIGLSGWYRLTDKNNPTIEEIKAAWLDKGYLSFMESLSKKFDRPVIIKLGYEGKDGAGRYSSTYGMPLGPDLQEQADCYQAALQVLWGQPWLKGIYWWHWWVTQIGGTSDYSYTPFGKPAEDVLKSFYLSP